jgi:cell division topological specificity factor
MVSLRSMTGLDRGKSAGVAKERLQIILALERVDSTGSEPSYLLELQRELVVVVSRYVKIDVNDIKVHFERQDACEVLEVKVELPERR